MRSRPLCVIGLATLAWAALAAPAMAQGRYPSPPNSVGQNPQGPYSPAQSPPTQPRSPYCVQLEAQLGALDRGTSDATASDQAKRYEDAIRKQQNDLDRLTAQARRAGCDSGGFFSLFSGQPAQCSPLNAQIQQVRANLDRTMNDYQRAQSNTGADHENQRRAIINALAQNDCGPQYSRLANQGGSFFDRLFGPGTIITPDAGPSSSPSGTYKTLCVRTCDGYYFPISYSTVPSKFADDEKTCQKLCPAADVALYSHRSSGEDVSQAVSTTGRLYTELANAFLYRKQFNPSCSCKAPGQTWADALRPLDDPTIERGDIVVTEERAKLMSQPQTDAQGKPIKPTPPARGGAAQPPPATPAAASANAADTTDTDTSKRKVRAVGPTFLPAH
jgi:Protein of unknown function (DUF2865)